MKLTDKDMDNLKKLLNWFFTKKENGSICVALYRDNYGDNIKFSINSIHGQPNSFDGKEAVGSTLEEAMKEYAKQI